MRYHQAWVLLKYAINLNKYLYIHITCQKLEQDYSINFKSPKILKYSK